MASIIGRRYGCGEFKTIAAAITFLEETNFKQLKHANRKNPRRGKRMQNRLP